MSQETQNIGLNEYAKNWLAGALKTEKYNMTTGMFEEKVLGTIYHMPVPDGPNTAYIAKEVVQTTVWSGRMMIFTHVYIWLTKESGQVLDQGTAFSWMVDPSLRGQEFDAMTGRYYV